MTRHPPPSSGCRPRPWNFGVRLHRTRLAQHLATAPRPSTVDTGAEARRCCRQPGPGRAACGTSRRPSTMVFDDARMPTISGLPRQPVLMPRSRDRSPPCRGPRSRTRPRWCIRKRHCRSGRSVRRDVGRRLRPSKLADRVPRRFFLVVNAFQSPPAPKRPRSECRRPDIRTFDRKLTNLELRPSLQKLGVRRPGSRPWFKKHAPIAGTPTWTGRAGCCSGSGGHAWPFWQPTRPGSAPSILGGNR